MSYRLAKHILFRLSPEKSHKLTLDLLRFFFRPIIARYYKGKLPSVPISCLGLSFDNPLGLAAGFDKNADYVDVLLGLGFGFVEVGTVTPLPQEGNPKPRLFRLEQEGALINRMGFNNKGVDYVVSRLKKRKIKGVVGVNIGKNKATPIERAVDDYLYCLDTAYPVADYITINVSSPNTPGLRLLQSVSHLEGLLQALAERRYQLAQQYGYTRPLLLKISSDMLFSHITEVVDCAIKYNIEGLVLSNTSIERFNITHRHIDEAGGISGKPLSEKTQLMLSMLSHYVNNRLVLIGAGGIMNADDAQLVMKGGVSLIQVYTGFVYSGPGLILSILKQLKVL